MEFGNLVVVKIGTDTYLGELSSSDLKNASLIGSFNSELTIESFIDYIEKKALNNLRTVAFSNDATIVSRELSDEEEFCFASAQRIYQQATVTALPALINKRMRELWGKM